MIWLLSTQNERREAQHLNSQRATPSNLAARRILRALSLRFEVADQEPDPLSAKNY